jgi:hypothetical protein
VRPDLDTLKLWHEIAKRDAKTLKKAHKLLSDDNLVWDNDFEQIRLPLAKAMKSHSSLGLKADVDLIRIARILTKDK